MPDPAAVVIVPPQLGLARLAIPGFAGLSASERLQAAALALRRDLSVSGADLRIAATPAPGPTTSSGHAMVAWCSSSSDTNNKPLATDLPGAVQPGRLYWVGAPAGYLVGEMGAVVVEPNDAGQALPTEVAAMLAARGCQVVTDIVLVDRDSNALPDDRLALWSAASGVSLRDGSWPVTASVPLVAPPRARVRPVTTALDRTLRWALAAALVCAGLSAWRYASQPTPAPLPAAASTAPAPGALLDRISISAPDLLPHLQSATYAGGAWVLVLAEAYDAAAMQRATRMLEGNGLVVQSARAPGPRLRVSLPVESKPQ
jgi:hypothetical protein